MALLVLSFYNIYANSRTLSNLYFAGEPIGNLTREQLTRKVDSRLTNFEQSEILFEIRDGDGGTRVASSPTALGITFNREATVKRAFDLGKSGNIIRDLTGRFNFWAKQQTEPEYNVAWEQLTGELDRLFGQYDREARDATVVYARGWQILPEEAGEVIDRSGLTLALAQKLEELSSETIVVHKVGDEPKVMAAGAQRALARTKVLENQRIILVFAHDSWRLSGQNLRDILKFYPKGLEKGYETGLLVLGDLLAIRDWSGGSDETVELDVRLDEARLADFISAIAKSVNQETRDATIVFDGERVSQFTPAVDGRKLDERLTREILLSKFSIDNPDNRESITINLPVAVTKARIASDEINSLGIKELIGRGVSYFAGSIANRIHNVTLGAKRVSGTIVKPGETFSFNSRVGEVSGSTGYKQAYVISSGRTVLDDGGGICQVSTTIFRAALNAGLPIVARTAHAYRVGYYEQRGFRPGLDATVWSPAVDLVFQNDTGLHILVQAVVDPYDLELAVDIYGTRDGRRVELSQPIVSNLKPAPEPRYQDDPSLPKGTVKQVDFEAKGATSVFTRKVWRGSELSINDVFKSVYRPWQAVYLVGTGG